MGNISENSWEFIGMQEVLQAPIRIIPESSNYTGFGSIDHRSLDVQGYKSRKWFLQLGDDSVERVLMINQQIVLLFTSSGVSIPSRDHKELKCRLGRWPSPSTQWNNRDKIDSAEALNDVLTPETYQSCNISMLKQNIWFFARVYCHKHWNKQYLVK